MFGMSKTKCNSKDCKKRLSNVSSLDFILSSLRRPEFQLIMKNVFSLKYLFYFVPPVVGCTFLKE